MLSPSKKSPRGLRANPGPLQPDTEQQRLVQAKVKESKLTWRERKKLSRGGSASGSWGPTEKETAASPPPPPKRPSAVARELQPQFPHLAPEQIEKVLRETGGEVEVAKAKLVELEDSVLRSPRPSERFIPPETVHSPPPRVAALKAGMGSPESAAGESLSSLDGLLDRELARMNSMSPPHDHASRSVQGGSMDAASQVVEDAVLQLNRVLDETRLVSRRSEAATEQDESSIIVVPVGVDQEGDERNDEAVFDNDDDESDNDDDGHDDDSDAVEVSAPPVLSRASRKEDSMTQILAELTVPIPEHAKAHEHFVGPRLHDGEMGSPGFSKQDLRHSLRETDESETDRRVVLLKEMLAKGIIDHAEYRSRLSQIGHLEAYEERRSEGGGGGGDDDDDEEAPPPVPEFPDVLAVGTAPTNFEQVDLDLDELLNAVSPKTQRIPARAPVATPVAGPQQHQQRPVKASPVAVKEVKTLPASTMPPVKMPSNVAQCKECGVVIPPSLLNNPSFPLIFCPRCGKKLAK